MGAGAPVLVFEVQDPAGPLDAPEGALGAQFGELKVRMQPSPPVSVCPAAVMCSSAWAADPQHALQWQASVKQCSGGFPGCWERPRACRAGSPAVSGANACGGHLAHAQRIGAASGGCAARQVAEAGELGLAQRQLAGLAAASAAGGPAAGLAADLALWRSHLATREDAKLGAPPLRPHPTLPRSGP